MNPIATPAHIRTTWTLVVFCALFSLAALAIPLYVIRPFVPQGPHALAFALTVRGEAPWLSAVCVAIGAGAILWGWKSFRLASKMVLPLLLLITIAAACLSHVNIFEVMFKPYPAPSFGAPADAKVDADDKVLAVTFNGESHAYPIRTMGYHHIVNDVVAGQPIAATYCTLCHTGLVWSRKVAGGPGLVKWTLLTFRLAGINNGNALMRDEQTNSIWQQSTGEAIFGPLKGRHLTVVHSDELTFALWRSEQPKGLVLKPEVQYEAEYDPRDWEAHVALTHTVIDTSKSGIGPHELMLGVKVDWWTKAYPIKSILAARLIEDEAGPQAVLLLVGPDGTSIRAFTLGHPGYVDKPTFVRSDNSGDEIMKDVESGTGWNFQGCAISGKFAGQCLTPVDSHKDFWFDWLNHNPTTTVFKN